MTQSPYTVDVDTNLSTQFLEKNAWLVILHASRIPPHIGVLINATYNSLTIKGHELNISLAVLQKTIQQKKIETLFIPLKKHPVFSLSYQFEILQYHIQQFTQVNQSTTCLSPVKLFLQEFYAIPFNENELLFELMERLKQNDYIEKGIALNLKQTLTAPQEFTLPMYNITQLQEVIKNERAIYYKD